MNNSTHPVRIPFAKSPPPSSGNTNIICYINAKRNINTDTKLILILILTLKLILILNPETNTTTNINTNTIAKDYY